MKKTTIITASLFMSLFVLSCGNKPSEKTTAPTEIVTHDEHEHDDKVEVLELNNGEKWAVNEEMKPYVNNGEQLVNDYIAKKGNDYSELATNLKAQNDQLITSCTMDGKSHDVLHVWLHPHLGLVKELSKAETNDAANEIIVRLEKSYETYHQFFQ